MSYLSFPFQALLKLRQKTELSLVKSSGLSRGCVRSVARGDRTCSIQSLIKVAEALGCQVSILVSGEPGLSEFSTVATSLKIQRDGFSSWKIHVMDFVDEYRRTLDPGLTLLPPMNDTEPRMKALLASTVCYLCLEAKVCPPAWAEKNYYLAQPWFVSEMQSLKASALLESPLVFRRNNIFTLDNFLTRV